MNLFQTSVLKRELEDQGKSVIEKVGSEKLSKTDKFEWL